LAASSAFAIPAIDHIPRTIVEGKGNESAIVLLIINQMIDDDIDYDGVLFLLFVNQYYFNILS
jgi:hypothetical protein